MADDSPLPVSEDAELEDAGSGRSPRPRASGPAAVLLGSSRLFRPSDVIRGIGRIALPRRRCRIRRASAGADSAAGRAFGTPQRGPPARRRRDVQHLQRRAALRSEDAAHDLHRVPADQLGGRARVAITGATSTCPRTVTDRRHGLQGRRRAVPREFVVPDGADRVQALVQPGLRSTHPDQQVGGYNTLNLLNANSDPTFVRTVLYSGDRAQLHRRAEGQLRPCRDQWRELGRST